MITKLKKYKKSIFIIAMAIILVTIGAIISQASISMSELLQGPNIGKTIKVGWNGGDGYIPLRNSKYLYCVQHQRTMAANTYTVSKYVEIEGKTATANNGKKVTDNANAILAYILGGGNYAKGYGSGDSLGNGVYETTTRQKALWSYFDTWGSKVGTPLGINWSDYNNNSEQNSNASKELIQEAKNYAATDGEATIKNLGSSTITTSNTMAGPFKVAYTGTITSIAVKDVNGNQITSGISFYTDKEGKNSVKIGDIKSGSNFYIKNTSGKNLKSVTIKVESSNTIIAKIWFLKNSSNSLQRLIAVDTDKKKTEASVTINIELLGKLTINKVDEETGEKLDAGFKIKTSSGWLSGTNGSYNYKASFDNATIYRTKNGVCTLNDLKFDKYYIYEVEAPKGYELSAQGDKYDEKNNWVYFGVATVNGTNKNVSLTLKNAKYGNLIITKKPEENVDIKLRAGFKIETESGWLSGTKGSYKYDNNFENATIYYTDNGTAIIENLRYGKYKVYEVEAPKGYDLSEQENYNSEKQWVEFGEITIDQNNKEVKMTLINIYYGDLKITKVDKENPDIKLRAGFKVETEYGWLSGTKGSYKYDNSFENADTYYTDNGEITLESLKYGKYKVYEVEAPEGYDLEDQDNYQDGKVYVGEVIITSTNSNREVALAQTNIKMISITGYVWVDVPETKDNDYDSLYNDNETRVSGVTVNLVNKTTKQVKATTTTDENGVYLFEKQLITTELKDYYVEFNYAGTEYKSYIPVAFNSVNPEEIKENGSRALMSSIPTEDSKLNGIATTYQGTDSEKETIYGLSGNLYKYSKFNESTNTLENINLGIKQLKEPDYRIEENIAYVKVVMKGYTYTYNYGGAGDKNATAAPTVRWQDDSTISAYSRPIYPSDIVYDVKNSTEELKVYVIYRIDITNTTTYDIEELYQEQKMYVTSLTNKFDTTRYELHDNNWEANGDTATIKSGYLNQIYGNGIGKNNRATSFIEFSVKHDAIIEILKHPNGIIEKFPTEATSNAYHEYTRKDYSWQNDITAEQTHHTSEDIRKADAPYLILKLGEERAISGKVFEDTVVTTNGEKLGNGTYEDTENVAKDVKVELLDVSDSTEDITKLNVSTLYKVNDVGDGTKEPIIEPAETKTDDKGNYTLAGIVPGYYYVRFTYGDGTQKLYDSNGNQVKDSNGNEKSISANEYKSTIVTSTVAKNALGYDENTFNELWYKHLEGTNYSVAVDNTESKEKFNSGDSSMPNVMAGTAKISITIESTDEDSANVEINQNEDGTTTQVENQYHIFNGFNFGIIEQPKQDVKVEKLITNMKLVNAQNNMVFDGNPETDVLTGVSDLDGEENGGSTYTRVEVNENEIYGSTITIKYTIRVTNTSDVNYYGNKYYWFGDKTGAYEVTLKIDNVLDYLDKTLEYIPDASKDRITVLDDGTDEVILSITGWDTLYTINNKERAQEKQTSDDVEILAQRLLSTEDDDLEIINEAEVVKASISSDPDDTDPDKDEKIKVITPQISLMGRVKATATITPPTGKDKQSITLYVITGIVTLAILSAGVVIIKKKIL